MLGRTHFFIGTAAALAVLQPQTVPALVAGAGAAAIGGLISDIDVGTSQAHRDADKIITATVAVAVLTILAEYKLNLGIYRRLTSDIADGVRGHHLPGCVRLFCRGLSVPSGARFFQPETGKAVLALEEGILPRILLSTGTCEPRTARVRHGISCCSTGALGACRAADG